MRLVVSNTPVHNRPPPLLCTGVGSSRSAKGDPERSFLKLPYFNSSIDATVASSGNVSISANTEVVPSLPDVMTVPLPRVPELKASVFQLPFCDNSASITASAINFFFSSTLDESADLYQLHQQVNRIELRL